MGFAAFNCRMPLLALLPIDIQGNSLQSIDGDSAGLDLIVNCNYSVLLIDASGSLDSFIPFSILNKSTHLCSFHNLDRLWQTR